MRLTAIGLATLLMLATTVSSIAQANSTGDSVDDLQRETRELGDALKNFSVDQKDQAEAAINDTLNHLDRRIIELEDQLEDNWDTMSQTSRERSRKTLQSLREQRDRAASWLRDLEASSASAWQRTRDGFSDAYQELTERWNRAEEAFRSKPE